MGPNLWNNPENNDFNLEFMDLDEFLSETGIGTGDNSNSSEGGLAVSPPPSPAGNDSLLPNSHHKNSHLFNFINITIVD